MPTEQDIYKVFKAAGFSNLHELKKTARFTNLANNEYVYINRERLPQQIHVYVHPELQDPNISGAKVVGNRLIRGLRVQFRSNLTKYPKTMHTGQTECHYGKGVEVENSASLAGVLLWHSTQQN